MWRTLSTLHGKDVCRNVSNIDHSENEAIYCRLLVCSTHQIYGIIIIPALSGLTEAYPLRILQNPFDLAPILLSLLLTLVLPPPRQSLHHKYIVQEKFRACVCVRVRIITKLWSRSACLKQVLGHQPEEGRRESSINRADNCGRHLIILERSGRECGSVLFRQSCTEN
jgi:hypothetical protein